jgi:hypothetical protein
VESPLSDGIPARSAAWVKWPARAPATAILLIGGAFLLLYTASLIWLPKPDGRIVVGDAVQYYVQLRSAVFDRDLAFHNENLAFYGRDPSNGQGWQVYGQTQTGHAPNFMSVGPAVVWAPLYLITTALIALANAAGAGYPLDGYGRLFQASAGISGVIAATLGAWLAFLWARRVFGTSAAIWATLAVWLGSSTIYYSLISPTYAHAASMFTSALFFYAWGTTLDQQTNRRYLLVGLLCGLNALVRWQDMIFLAAPALDAVWSLARNRPLTGRKLMVTAGRIGVCLGATLAAFLPQMLVWSVIYGTPVLVPQGQGFMHWTSPSLWAVLFSDHHGLISWTPIIALALAGCAWLPRTNRLLGTVALVIVVCEWYAISAVADWWGGEAYGARRFISCFPLFVLGLAALGAHLARYTRWLAATVTALVGLNFLLLVQYQAYLKGLRDIVPYPEGFYGLWVARFVVPFHLVARLWHALLS